MNNTELRWQCRARWTQNRTLTPSTLFKHNQVWQTQFTNVSEGKPSTNKIA